MAATVKIREKNTVSETATDKTSGTVRFKLADNATVDLNNPMVIPASSSTFSFRKYLRLQISAAGGFTQISNLRAYSDGTIGFGTGVTLYGKAVGPFATPIQETSSSGYTAMGSFTSGSPLDMDGNNAGPFTPDSPFVAKDIGDYLQMALEVASTAAQGVLTAETLTFAYDEI